MAGSLHKLTVIQAAKLKVPGRHSDGGGLYLSIDGSDRRRWVFIYTRGGRRTELGLGGGRDLSLTNARVEAAAFRAMLADGLDPKVERAKDDQAQTFGEAESAGHAQRTEVGEGAFVEQTGAHRADRIQKSLTIAWQMSMPRSNKNSSTLRRGSGCFTCIIATKPD